MKKGQTSKTDGIENILIPMYNFNCTQGDFEGNHPYYACDMAGKDTGKEPAYFPFSAVCVATNPIDGNAVWWQSQNKVRFADGTIDYATIMILHDNSLDGIYVGAKYPQGHQMALEGNKAHPSLGGWVGTHLHFEIAKGKYTHMYDSNNKGYYLPRGMAIEKACFADGTNFINSKNWKWKYTKDIKPSGSNYKITKEDWAIRVTVDEINIRKEPKSNAKKSGSLKMNDERKYIAKTVNDGHRWVRLEDKNWVAINGSETANKDMWVKLIDPKDMKENQKPNYKVEKETYAIRLKVDGVQIRKEPSKSAKVVGTLNTGDEREYISKTTNDGHRWVQLKDKTWVAITPKEDRSEEWVALIDPKDMAINKPTEPPKEPEKPVDPPKVDKNVKAWGVDISEHNESYDVKGQGFVIIRATWGTNTDTLFLQNVKKCQDNKIPFGVYCYSYAIDDDGAISEADYIMKLLQDNNIVPTVGVWFDMEDADGYKQKNNALDKAKITRWCKLFCDKLSSQGYYTGVYSNTDWFGRLVETNYPRWYANWGTNDGTLQNDFSNLENVVLHQYAANPIDKNCSYVPLDTFKSNPKPIEQEKPQEEKPNESEPKPEKPNIEEENKGLINKLLKLLINFFSRLLGKK